MRPPIDTAWDPLEYQPGNRISAHASRAGAHQEETMRYTTVAAAAAALAFGAPAGAENFKLRIASGHAAPTAYVNLMTTFFVPEVTKRVAARTKHRVEFIEGYGGSMVKVADTLEGVQSGIIDIGGYCMCFEPSNLPLHSFQVVLPFGTMSAVQSVKMTRAVYDKVPYMAKVLEDKFNQKQLALIADNGYNLGTSFEWNTVADLKGRKLGGAGLNLKWLEFAGAVPVQTSLPEVYTSMQTGVYQGMILFPSAYVNFKLQEVGPHYTLVGFGAITWHTLNINRNRFNRLPKDVQDILVEVGREYEARTGTVNEENYQAQLDALTKAGAKVKPVPDSVRVEWAKSLAAWPQQRADELDKQGLPASQVLKLGLEEAEKLGYKWPVRYSVK